MARSRSDVIDAIQKASDAELRALANISRQLANWRGAGGAMPVKVTRQNAANGNFRQPRQNNTALMISEAMGGSYTANNAGGIASQSTTTRLRKARNKSRNSSQKDSLPTQISLQTVRKSRQMIQKVVNGSYEAISETILEAIESDIRAQSGHITTTKRRNQITSNDKAVRRNHAANDAPGNGRYYDKGGRLRESNGKYASQSASEKANNNRRNADDDEQKETNALLRKVLGTALSKTASGLTGEDNGNLAAGAAGMGVMWQASKEMMGLVKDAGSNTIAMSKWVKETHSGIKNRKPILRGFGANDARGSVSESKKLDSEAAQKQQHKDADATHTNQEKEIALLTELVHKKGGADGEGGGLMSGLASMLGLKFGARMLGKAGKFGGKIFGKLGGNALARVGGKMIGKVGAGVAGVGLATKGIEKLGEGSLVKTGEKGLIKAGAKGAAKVGLKALPVIGTILSSAWDAYDGWNDDEGLKRTFGDKVGTKQRAEMAAGNVLDMGGLVSGTSNLISGVLNGMGFKDAAKAMHLSGAEGIAKNLENLFGDGEKKDDDRNKSLLDKLTDVVTGIAGVKDAMTIQGRARLNDTVSTFASDIAATNVRTLPMATQSIYDARGNANQARKARGWTYNPQAMITLGGKNSTTRGIAMNNPTNLNFNNQAGAMKEVGNSQARFASFATPEEGIRAAGNNLLSYKKQGKVTLRDILMKWAPPADNNDTGKYINTVARAMGPGYTGNTIIDANDPVVTSRLIQAFGTYENGSMNMTQADVQKSLGTVQGGRYVGGWTDATQAELSKTEQGRKVLANNTGAGNAVISASSNGAAAATTASNSSQQSSVMSMINSVASVINNTAGAAVPGVVYDSSKAGMGLSAVKKTKIASALNGDSLVNASAKNALPVPAQLSGGNNGILSSVFNDATQGITGQGIVGGLTKGINPQWARALSPLTNVVGNTLNNTINSGRESVSGWLNGSPSTMQSVTNLAASGAAQPVSPDRSMQKGVKDQLSKLDEIAGYLEKLLDIQKRAPRGAVDAVKPGPQPGPTGDIPLSSRSSVMNEILKR